MKKVLKPQSHALYKYQRLQECMVNKLQPEADAVIMHFGIQIQISHLTFF